MKKFLLAGLLLPWLCFAFAQGQTPPQQPKGKPYKLWLRSTNSTKISAGYLHALTDSSITVDRGWYYKPMEKQEFQATQIKWVKFRKDGKTRRGAGIGAALGFVTGLAWGVALGDDQPCPPQSWVCFSLTRFQKGLLISCATVPVGGLVGWLVSSGKTKITIDGKRSEYIRQRKLIESYMRN